MQEAIFFSISFIYNPIANRSQVAVVVDTSLGQALCSFYICFCKSTWKVPLSKCFNFFLSIHSFMQDNKIIKIRTTKSLNHV